MVEKSTSLDNRYGRSRKKISRKKATLISAAVLLLAIIALAYFAWTTSRTPTLTGVAGKLESNNSVTVNFTVHNPTKDKLRCSVRALNNHYAVVGYKTIDIDVSDNPTSEHSVNVLTDSPAANADVDKCWTLA